MLCRSNVMCATITAAVHPSYYMLLWPKCIRDEDDEDWGAWTKTGRCVADEFVTFISLSKFWPLRCGSYYNLILCRSLQNSDWRDIFTIHSTTSELDAPNSVWDAAKLLSSNPYTVTARAQNTLNWRWLLSCACRNGSQLIAVKQLGNILGGQESLKLYLEFLKGSDKVDIIILK